MQIVIELSNDTYNRLLPTDCTDGYVRADVVADAIRAVRSGTVLPKGHGNLKDVDSIFNEGFPKADINAECEDNKKEYPNWLTDITGFQSVLKNAPTIIEADKEESEDKE